MLPSAIADVFGSLLTADPAVSRGRLHALLGHQLRALLLRRADLAGVALPRLAMLLDDTSIAPVGSPCMSAGASLCTAAVRALALQVDSAQVSTHVSAHVSAHVSGHVSAHVSGRAERVPSAAALAAGIQVATRVVLLTLDGGVPERCSSVLHDGAMALAVEAVQAWLALAAYAAAAGVSGAHSLRSAGAERAAALVRAVPASNASKPTRGHAGAPPTAAGAPRGAVPMWASVFSRLLQVSSLPMASDGFRWLLTASDGFRWLPMASDRFRWLPMASDGFRLLPIASDRLRLPQIASDCL